MKIDFHNIQLRHSGNFTHGINKHRFESPIMDIGQNRKIDFIDNFIIKAPLK